jgi:hypothetical protein
VKHDLAWPERAHRATFLAFALLLLPLLFGCLSAVAEEREEAATDQCVECHSNPRFLVTNKKLYDYFQEWELSVHKQEEVACVDCHGGNPGESDKQKAHGAGVGASDTASGIYFGNVVKTCGDCHEEILEGFRESNHFEHMVAGEEEEQGPTCVTCHGSINVVILDVNSVQAACIRCHNEETENNPDIPDKARVILNRFLSMHRFYRYIAIRAEPLESRQFFHEVDPTLKKLSVTWHTFDLEQIGAETSQVLAILKAKRDEVRARVKKQRSEEEE